MLFYEQARPVNAERHRDWSITAVDDFAFAREANAVPLTSVEFSKAAASFPVVFAGQGQRVAPLALLGFEDGQNVFVGRKLGHLFD